MITLSILLFTTAFFQGSVLASKVQPVDLVYSCLRLGGEKGRNDDIPLILLHGLMANKEMFHGINEVLAWETGKRVCVVDLRNHGESPWSDELDIAAMTEDVKHFLDYIKAPKVVVLGVSLGGKIAVHLALNYPDIVEKIISVDMRPNGLSPESIQDIVTDVAVFKDLDKLVPEGVDDEVAEQTLLKIVNDRLAKANMSWTFNDTSGLPLKCSQGECRWKWNPKLLQTVLDNILDMWTDSSGRFDGPALFIYGTISSFKIGEDEENIKKLFPNAKLVGVKGAEHVVHTFPEFMTEVIKFINHE